METEELYCEHCGREGEELTEIDGEGYCQDCVDNLFTVCVSCGEWIANGDVRSCNNCNDYCEDCFTMQFASCDRCGDHTPNDELFITSHDGMVCQGCFERAYFTCNNCNEVLCYSRYDDSGRCESCIRVVEEIENSSIADYGHTRAKKFFGEDNDLYLGIELEIESEKSVREDLADEIRALDAKRDLFDLKEDGSLDCGFELATQPATLEYHQKQFPWMDITRLYDKYDAKSHDTSTCGLHIHISRRPLTEEQEIKITYFVNMYSEFMCRIARRDYNGFARKAEKKLAKGQNYSYSRYESVNFGDATLEIRLFRGTTKHKTILATIEFTHALVRFCEDVSSETMSSQENALKTFRAYVEASEQYQNFVAYANEREAWQCV